MAIPNRNTPSGERPSKTHRHANGTTIMCPTRRGPGRYELGPCPASPFSSQLPAFGYTAVSRPMFIRLISHVLVTLMLVVFCIGANAHSFPGVHPQRRCPPSG